jgi:hypothetical protein
MDFTVDRALVVPLKRQFDRDNGAGAGRGVYVTDASQTRYALLNPE